MFDCQLQTIELGAFNGLTQLTYLSMSFNHISETIPRTFENMSRLEILGLPYNSIQYLESDAFFRMFNLKNIYLDGNNL
jgi:Leucine-rich repeat (LRR) protein